MASTLFTVAAYDSKRGGYPVLRETFPVAFFIEEIEAQHYAQYRNTMLDRYNTTDTAQYRI